MAFQLREYARWLNNTYSLARFSQMTRDWQVPSEAQTPLQDVNSDETDKTSVNTGVSNWRIAYATIRIYRDGSIQTVDAYGNSITTTAIGIQISTPKNLLLQAGGSVNIVAGRDVNILARNNVGVTSVNAAIRLKSKTALMLFCSAGNVIYEIASSFFHKFIGNITANNTVDITTAGTIDASVSVNTPTLNADTLSATGVTIKNGLLSANKAEVTTINTQTVNVENSNSVSWPGLQNEISSSFSVSVSQLSDIFLFQTEYDGGTLYQTFTQQMLETGDVKTTASIWSFSDNSADGRGAPWPGASAQEMTTSSGDPLNTPSSNTKFSEKPATMTLQSPRLIVS
jgi:Tfp pilus assembly protein PilV